MIKKKKVTIFTLYHQFNEAIKFILAKKKFLKKDLDLENLLQFQYILHILYISFSDLV